MPIGGDGNYLFRAISICIYGSEDFQVKIREKVILNITTRWGLLNEFTISKESVVYKEYEVYYGFRVCSTDLHAVFKTEKSSGWEPRSRKVARTLLSKVGAGREPFRRAARAASVINITKPGKKVNFYEN
ncbi:hypothetical protein AVEN_159402-1 [Araneus ventricosus]|uniref:OTU domain-containing protein n=1 Tax=Araneus ventricosus TaxID=182803 RepID=A0A4Y2A1X9_ARAVE|nr:hypothetical protein AVEN_159402-1 [Araneus ventricosus]